MSANSDYRPPSETAARYLAEKGEAAIRQMEATIARAREMLAQGEVIEPLDGVDPHRFVYPWETTEVPHGALPRIWCASVDDFATGEGLTVRFAAGFARCEDEFRRRISHEFGRAHADGAKLGEGLGSNVPFKNIFLSKRLRVALERFHRGEDRPGAVYFVAQYHTNFS